MFVFNEDILEKGSPKIVIVKNHIADTDRGKLTKYGLEMFKFGISPKEVCYISLFDKPTKKFGIGELREAIKELEEFLRIVGCNVLVDDSYTFDAKTKKTVKGLIFKNIFNRDNTLWKDRGVLEASFNGVKVKSVCTLRWETIAREKDSKDLIDSEFIVNPDLVEIVIPKTVEEAKACFKELFQSKTIVYDTEASSTDVFRKDFKMYTAQFTGMNNKDKAFIFFYDHPKRPQTKEFKENVSKGIKWVCENRNIIAHNQSYDLVMAMRLFNVDIYKTNFYDSMIIWHFLTNTYEDVPLGLKHICFTQGIFNDWEWKLDIEKKRICSEMKIKKDDFKYEYFDVDDLTLYGGYDVIALAYLWEKLQELSKNHIALDVIKETWEGEHGWMNLMKGTYRMMMNGTPFNLDKANELKDKHEKRLIQIEDLIKEDKYIKMAETRINKMNWEKALEAYDKKVQQAKDKGKEFKGKAPEKDKGKYGSIDYNVAFSTTSPIHMKTLFFDVLKFPVLSKSKTTGEPALGKDNLNAYFKMKPDLSIIKLFDEKAKISKVLTTYLNGWITKVEDSCDNRLHSSFNPLTTSARYKGSEGSLLNVPKGKGLKELMESNYKEGWVTLGLDMSALEYNVGVMLHKCPAHLKLREKNITDFHSLNACIIDKALGRGELSKYDMFNPKDLKEIKSEFGKRRGEAKALTFGVSYNCTHFSLMKSFGINEQVAKDILNTYWSTYSGERDFINESAKIFAEQGYRINFGNVPVLSPNMTTNLEDMDNMNKFRTLYNSIAQSSAYGVVRAMYLADKYFLENGYDVKFYNSIYDSVIVECKLEDVKLVREKCIEFLTMDIMENQPFPLEADCEIGISYEPEMDFEGNDEELDKLLEIFNYYNQPYEYQGKKYRRLYDRYLELTQEDEYKDLNIKEFVKMRKENKIE